MTQILIDGGYGWEDTGDESMLSVMLDRLKRMLPDARITLICPKKIRTKNYAELYGVRTINLRGHLLYDSQRLLRELLRTDIFLGGPGGYITDIWWETGKRICLLFLIAGILRKQSMLYAQGVGPFFTEKHKLFARLALNKANIITVRDKKSELTLKEIGITRPLVECTADESLLLPPASNGRVMEIMKVEGVKLDKPLLGISARRWFHRARKYTCPEGNPQLGKAKLMEYKQALASVADHFVSEYNAQVIFVSMQTLEGTKEDDRVISNEIAQLMEFKNNAIIVRGKYSPEEIKGIIGKMDLLIGTRYHSLISAASMGVPVVCVSYDPKNDEWMKAIHLEKYLCQINALNVNDLLSKAKEAWAERSNIRETLKATISTLENRAQRNAELFRSLTNEKHYT